MEFNIKSGHPEKQRTACIILGIYEPRRLSEIAKRIDKVSDGYLSSILRRGDLEGFPGQSLLLHNGKVVDIKPARLRFAFRSASACPK